MYEVKQLKKTTNEMQMKKAEKSHKHNAKLLLQLYRKVSFHVRDRIQMKGEELYESRNKELKDLVISFLEIDNTVDVKKLEESLIDINVSLTLLELMDLALERLGRYPNNGSIYAQMLRLRYFEDEIMTCEALFAKFNMSRSTYFRYLNKAIETFGTMLFGYALPEIVQALEVIQKLPIVAEITESYKT